MTGTCEGYDKLLCDFLVFFLLTGLTRAARLISQNRIPTHAEAWTGDQLNEHLVLIRFYRETTYMVSRYVIAGGLSLAMNILTVAFLVENNILSVPAATAVSFAIIFAINFLIARFWIFSATQVTWADQIPKFIIINFAMRVAEYALFVLLFTILAFHYSLCIVLSLAISNIVKFLAYKNLVFAVNRSDNLQKTSCGQV